MNPDGRRIRIRLGLFSGDITAAVVGTKMKRMTMIGDTVRAWGSPCPREGCWAVSGTRGRPYTGRGAFGVG